MTLIVLNDDQAKAIAEASGAVEVRDLQGRYLGCITDRVTEEDIDGRSARNSKGPRYSMREVLEYLESLAEA